jgi:hypothetical protein
VPRSGLTKTLKDEIARLRPSGAYFVGTKPLSAKVQTDVSAAGVKDVTRIEAATPEATAAAVANALDTRSTDDKAKATAAAPAAVVVNPASPDAAASAGLAAALGYPVLFTGRDATPAATTSAIASLNISQVLVVGGPAAVSDAVLGQLPGAKRLGGADAAATSVAAAGDAAGSGVPANLVYVADPGRPADAAVAGAAVARAGGLLVLVPHADAAQAQRDLGSLHLGGPIDQVVVVHSKTPATSHTLLIVIFIVLGAIGLVLLWAAFAMRARSRERAGAAA